MKARLVKFGEIEVEGKRYTYDVVIEGGKVRKRKKGPNQASHDGQRLNFAAIKMWMARLYPAYAPHSKPSSRSSRRMTSLSMPRASGPEVTRSRPRPTCSRRYARRSTMMVFRSSPVPVDYSENMKLTAKLGALTDPL
jgi:hypothetical protein